MSSKIKHLIRIRFSRLCLAPLLALITLSACTQSQAPTIEEVTVEETGQTETVKTEDEINTDIDINEDIIEEDATEVDDDPESSTEEAGAEVVTEPIVEESVAIIPTDIIISAIQTGQQGNNLSELIELYNPLDQAIDLKGYMLIYHARDSFEPVILKSWRVRSDIPAGGYYLLGQDGQAFDLLTDDTFEETMISRGLLVLTDPAGEIADLVAFGEPPAGDRIGEPAPAAPNGVALVRTQLGAAINNASDYEATSEPVFHNSGTPSLNQPVSLNISLPESIGPGEQFNLEITLEGDLDEGGTLSIPLPNNFDAQFDGQPLTGQMGEIPIEPGSDGPVSIQMTAPFVYQQTTVNGIYFSDRDGSRSYGPVLELAIADGAVPIAVARGLVNQTVTVEGVATMYTDGFFAGSSGTKFYIQDDSGGVQVYVPGGKGGVSIEIGDRVRVTGTTEIYRTAFEVIPSDFSTDIEILGREESPPDPIIVSPGTMTNDQSVMGQLTTVEGTATRIEERTYSYEVDIKDEEGNTAQVYIDKLTEATTEGMQVGEQYRMTGIGESYDGQQQLYLRQQSDIARIFPPAIRIEVNATASTNGEMVPVDIVIINDTPETLTNTFVSTRRPGGAVKEVTLVNDIIATEPIINWVIPSLSGNGGQVVLPMTLHIDLDRIESSSIIEQLRLYPVSASSPDWPDQALATERSIFIGESVPIWAIQGKEDSSAYVGQQLTTEGIITGIFPGLNGFFVQAARSDFLNNTSDGIFVTSEPETDFTTIPFAEGDAVQLRGTVREIAGQTTFYLDSLDEIRAGTHDRPIRPVELTTGESMTNTLAAFETLEGMLVTISEPAVAVAPTSQYGEYVIVRASDEAEIGDDNRVTKGIDPIHSLIMVDDGSTMRHEDGATLPYAIQTGDRLTGLRGPLAFTFGRYKMEPLAPPSITQSDLDLPEITDQSQSESPTLAVATFNVENFFDPFDPHPSSPPLPTLTEYEHKITKLADAIIRMGYPDIIALQEVENERVLSKLVAHPDLAVSYVPILLEGEDSRGIDNGFLVREGIAVNSVTQHPMPDGSLSRHPLMLDLSIDSGSSGDAPFELVLINNHFSSMSAGVEATEPRRLGQAEWIVGLVEEIRAERPTSNVIVLGDLNSFYVSVPMEAFRQAGLNHVYELAEAKGEPRPYTYIFEGESETLDHIFVTPELFELAIDVRALHINADFPVPDPEDNSARRSSDHDPLIVVFELP